MKGFALVKCINMLINLTFNSIETPCNKDFFLYIFKLIMQIVH